LTLLRLGRWKKKKEYGLKRRRRKIISNCPGKTISWGRYFSQKPKIREGRKAKRVYRPKGKEGPKMIRFLKRNIALTRKEEGKRGAKKSRGRQPARKGSEIGARK